eukprot:scaffold24687_cov104-Isochrysis_galbana.AAC.4
MRHRDTETLRVRDIKRHSTWRDNGETASRRRDASEVVIGLTALTLICAVAGRLARPATRPLTDAARSATRAPSGAGPRDEGAPPLSSPLFEAPDRADAGRVGADEEPFSDRALSELSDGAARSEPQAIAGTSGPPDVAGRGCPPAAAARAATI